MAATGGLATSNGTVLAASHAGPLSLDVAMAPVQFGGVIRPAPQAVPPAAHASSPAAQAVAPALVAPALAPHQLPAQTPKHPVVRIRVATATNKAPHQAAPASHGAAQHSASSHQQHSQHQVQPARPFLIYDSVTPTAIPPHRMVATYATGGYAVPASQVAGRGRVLWIDTQGTDPKAAALDVEPGDATPSIAASWAWHKLSATPAAVARIYTMISEWPAVKAAIATLPHRMQSHVRYWIADPTGVPHVLPGASATQWYWGHSYDISTAKPGF